METNNAVSSASFLRWMKPVLQALKEVGGSGTPQEVRNRIIQDEHLTEEEQSETRGKSNVNKFENEVAWARAYLVSAGYIDNSVRGIWKLTESGKKVNMTYELASDIKKQYASKTRKEADYSWINFYMEFADALLAYKNSRAELIEKIREVFGLTEMKLPKLEADDDLEDIDPFTVFGLFNKGISDKNRIKILNAISEVFEIRSAVPRTFHGIPVVNNLKATFYYFKGNRGAHDIDNLWNVFQKALQYADSFSEAYKRELEHCYDIVKGQKGINWNITMGLYWIRPNSFINLDARNREFLTNTDSMPPSFTEIFANLNRELPEGASYLCMCEQAREALKGEEYPFHNFPELSFYAWKMTRQNETMDKGRAAVDANVKETGYWIYSPGDNACMWDEFYQLGIMGIGWDEVKDLKDFSSKEEIKNYMKTVYDASYSYKNNAHCLWQFANEIQIGDVIFVKKGMHKIVGRGIVTSDYIYDPARTSYKHIRKVDWQNKGEWEHPRQAVMKTLTNISAYPDYVQSLQDLFAEDTSEELEEKEGNYLSYTKENFLEEVFMDEEAYDTLVELVETKYNVILQGAPGVGKTFAAKRLAYSMMGQTDISRVAMVQFHQSYSYEDFIQGYRPTKEGFELENGVFYKFCKAAEEDNENLYFFIIDEINRGNLSKILGELMMLLEKDKRGEKIKLLYSNEWFTVPDNIRIIGMMNTADRSLAMMDYALRRRFAFFDFAPAFASEGFRTYLEEKSSAKLEKLISVVENLNNAISADESLGEGFRIGHSYFCTDKEITDRWLHSVVEYEVIPLIKEYWFDEPAKVRDWSSNLREAIQ